MNLVAEWKEMKVRNNWHIGFGTVNILHCIFKNPEQVIFSYGYRIFLSDDASVPGAIQVIEFSAQTIAFEDKRKAHAYF